MEEDDVACLEVFTTRFANGCLGVERDLGLVAAFLTRRVGTYASLLSEKS